MYSLADSTNVFYFVSFQGVLTVQAYIYFESFPNDSRKTKLLVRSLRLSPAIILN